MHRDYMSATIVVYTDHFFAKYEGGAYIDLYAYGADAPYAAVAVWDHAAMKPSIAFTPVAVMNTLTSMKPDDPRLDPTIWD